MANPEVPEIFVLVSKLGNDELARKGYENLPQHPGVLKLDVGRWTVEVHARDSEVDGLPPAVIRLSYNGWPAGFVDAAGGVIAGGAAANEKTLIAALQTELGRRQRE